jgi:hypothetical protein
MRVGSESVANQREAVDWMCKCDALYEWPEPFSSARLLTPSEAFKKLKASERRDLVQRHKLFKTLFRQYRILDIWSTRNGITVPGLGRRFVGDVVTLNRCVVENVDAKTEKTTLRSLYKANGLAELPATVFRLVAVRDTFHGDKTYEPGESFEAVSEIACRLNDDGLAVPESEYPLRRLVRVKAVENFEHDGKDRAPGTEFEAPYCDAVRWEEMGTAELLQASKVQLPGSTDGREFELQKTGHEPADKSENATDEYIVRSMAPSHVFGDAYLSRVGSVGLGKETPGIGRTVESGIAVAELERMLDLIGEIRIRLQDFQPSNCFERAMPPAYCRELLEISERLLLYPRPLWFVDDKEGVYLELFSPLTDISCFRQEVTVSTVDHIPFRNGIVLRPEFHAAATKCFSEWERFLTLELKSLKRGIHQPIRAEVSDAGSDSATPEGPTETNELASTTLKRQRTKRTDKQKREAKQAAELMMREGKTLKEIALAIGYANASGVSKLLNGK